MIPLQMTGIGDNLKILAYEGIAPSRENIADGSCLLKDGYYAVIRSDQFKHFKRLDDAGLHRPASPLSIAAAEMRDRMKAQITATHHNHIV